MSKKIITLFLIGTLLLTSCGKEVVTEVISEDKKPFLVDTKQIIDFPKHYTLEKSGRLVGGSTISLSSQGAGRVKSISVKEGASIRKGQTLVLLSDTTANYDIRLAQARNALKNTQVTIESTRVQLDKTISDTNFALEKARSDFKALEDDSVKKLEKAERDANKSIVNSTGSDARIALEKAVLDFNNLKTANIQTIENFNSTYKLSYNDLKKFLTKLLYQGDKTFGITGTYKNETTSNRQYMGARDPSTRSGLEMAYDRILKANIELDSRSMIQIDESNVLSEIQGLSLYYGMIREYILAANSYIEGSITSTVFPQATIDGYTSEYTGYKSELSALEAAQTAFKNSSATFLSSYKNNEASAAAGLEVQKKNLVTGEYESTLGLERIQIGVNRDIEQSKIALNSAEANYNNAVVNKDITLKKLEVSLTDAKLSLEQAMKEFSKLSIISPIDATVTRVNVSVGQEVNAGLPMIEIASRNPEIIFNLDSTAVALLKIGSSQSVLYDGETYSGTVVGISQVANESLLYTARLMLQESPKYLGGIATIQLVLNSDYTMLPNEMVRIVSEKQGELSILSGSTIAIMNVALGSVINRSIEILTALPNDIEIITSDVSNFDEKKNTLVRRNQNN